MTKKFNYTYTALTEGEKREVERIRRQYQPNEEKKEWNALRTLTKKLTTGRRSLPLFWESSAVYCLG